MCMLLLWLLFQSFADIANQSEENLSLCPGFGANKVSCSRILKAVRAIESCAMETVHYKAAAVATLATS